MSRDLHKLQPLAYDHIKSFLDAAEEEHISVLVTCVDRTHEEQAALYAQGRTLPGHIVTNAKAGESYHEYCVAVDIVPLVAGKPLWSVFLPNGTMHPIWKRLGELAALSGVEWAGNWKSFKEYAHFQYTGGLTIADMKAGKVLPVG